MSSAFAVFGYNDYFITCFVGVSLVITLLLCFVWLLIVALFIVIFYCACVVMVA